MRSSIEKSTPNFADHWKDALRPENRNQLVHIAIDVQKIFCDPNKGGNTNTDRVASNISKIVPIFRSLNIQNHWTIDIENQTSKDYGFYLVKPRANETIIKKNLPSAFNYSSPDLDILLKNTKKKVLLISGVNFSSCIFQTVWDAKAKDRNYEVLLLSDLSTNGKIPNTREEHTKKMIDRGIIITTSTEVLKHLTPTKPIQPPTQPSPLQSLPHSATP